MIDYIIIVKKAGQEVRREVVPATNALTAISFVESTYPHHTVYLSNGNGCVKQYIYTGYEFEARQFRMELS